MTATDPNCIFCKIVRGEIPGRKVYEDADVLAFHDIQPVAPVHFMLIPKKHVASMYDLADEDAAGDGQDHDARRAPGARAGRERRLSHDRQHRPRRAGRTSSIVHVHVIGGPDPLGPMILRSRNQ